MTVWLLALLAGCHTSAGRITTCAPDDHRPRKAVAALQAVRDTAVETVHHPFRSTCTLACDPLHVLAAAGRSLLAKRLALDLAGPPGPLPSCPPEPASERDLHGPPCADLQPTSLQFYTEGADALAALEQVIDTATCRLDVLMFTWDNTPVGQTIAARLAARAGPGLRVRVLLDGSANLVFGRPEEAPACEVNRTVCWLARQPYVEVVRTRNAFAHLDHRKLVLADGRLACTGGRNFTEGFFERHDLTFTVAGPPARELQEVFERFWQDQGGQPGPPLPVEPVPCPNARARLVETGPLSHGLCRALYRAVEGARHHVWVENPYLSDPGLVFRLARARRRGADVRVVLAVEGDEDYITRANRVTANRLLDAGVRVYLYPGPLHTKAAVADGCWAYVGTGNFDVLSLRRNHELGLVLGAGPALDEVEQRVFLADFRPEWELCRPLPLSGPDYFYEVLACLFL